ncbi:MAG: phosphoribosylanthranilate isomerase [Candidatus Velthaea sp.]
MRTRIKFCGCTSAGDAEAAVGLGVDAIGVIFAPVSPRCVSAPAALEIARAVPALTALVGVFVRPAAAHVREALAAGYLPQFHGDEAASDCEAMTAGPYIKVFHLSPEHGARLDAAEFERQAGRYERATWMFDTTVDGKAGGTGRTFDWELARDIARRHRVIVSGGLTPENVGECVRRLRPYGVDVRSGIETGGVKDVAKMRAFVRAVKEADEQA